VIALYYPQFGANSWIVLTKTSGEIPTLQSLWQTVERFTSGEGPRHPILGLILEKGGNAVLGLVTEASPTLPLSVNPIG
jgi:hypothetical protein